MALHVAAATADPEMIQLLLEAGADPAVPDNEGNTVQDILLKLLEDEEAAHNAELCLDVLQRGGNPDMDEAGKESIIRENIVVQFLSACMDGNDTAVKDMLSSEKVSLADLPGWTTEAGDTALHREFIRLYGSISCDLSFSQWLVSLVT